MADIIVGDEQPRRVYQVGSEAQSEFTVPFPFLADTDVKVAVNSGTADHVLGLGADYTVSGAGSQTGTVTLTTPVSNCTVTVYRELVIERSTRFPAAGTLKMPALNREFDRATMIAQQLADRAKRSLSLAASDDLDTNATLPVAQQRASRLFVFDAEGRPVMSDATVQQVEGTAIASWAQGKSIGDVPAYVGDGVTTRYPTGHKLLSKAGVHVEVGGVRQAPNAYALDDEDVVLAAPPPVGVPVHIRVLGVPVPVADASESRVTAPGSAIPRTLTERAGDAVNVKDFGARSDGSAIATDAFVAATAAASEGSLVAQVPPGLYDLTGNPPGLPNTAYDMAGVRFTGLAPAFPDWVGDATFYTGAQPRTWRALEGAVDRHDGQFGQYVGMRVLDTSKGGTDPSPAYMKGAGYFKVITHDKSGRVGTSDPDTVTRDAVALTGAGTIAAGNTLGRAWSLFAHSICEAGADGLLAGLEIDMGNLAGVVQKGYNQPNTKTAVRLFATGHISCGIHFSADQSGAVANSRWHHAISIEPTALDSDGYAFRLIGNMAILTDGTTTIGSEATSGGGEKLAVTGFVGFGDTAKAAPYVVVGNTGSGRGVVGTASNHDVDVQAGGVKALRAVHAAGATNFVIVTPSTTAPTIGTNSGSLALAPATGVVKISGTSTPYLNVTDGTRTLNVGIDSSNSAQSSFFNASNGARFLASGGTITAVSYDASGNVSLGGAAGAEGLRVVPVASANRYVSVSGSNGGNPTISASAGLLNLGSALSLTNQTTGTTVGAAGAASALPAAPLGYLTISLNGSDVRIPYYN